MPLKKSARMAGVVALAAVSVISAAILIGARKTTEPRVDPVNLTAAAPEPQKEQPAPAAAKKMPVAKGAATKAVASKTTAASAPQTIAITPETVPAAQAASNASVQGQETATVTITGCLERDDDIFQLKDTAGIEAPKSRSWKSGFLKRSSASIELVDSANRLKLPTYVGQRISVTGMLDDRAMTVRSLRRVAEGCD